MTVHQKMSKTIIRDGFFLQSILIRIITSHRHDNQNAGDETTFSFRKSQNAVIPVFVEKDVKKMHRESPLHQARRGTDVRSPQRVTQTHINSSTACSLMLNPGK